MVPGPGQGTRGQMPPNDYIIAGNTPCHASRGYISRPAQKSPGRSSVPERKAVHIVDRVCLVPVPETDRKPRACHGRVPDHGAQIEAAARLDLERLGGAGCGRDVVVVHVHHAGAGERGRACVIRRRLARVGVCERVPVAAGVRIDVALV